MARALLDSKLTGTPRGCSRFALANSDDEEEIRSLLRQSPTPGRISLSFEREPDYFSDAHQPGQTKQTIIARERERIACMGTCVVRRLFVNGHPRRVGYLGALRLDSAFAGRFDIVRRGYEFFRELQSDAAADFYFTSIAADNERARRFLEHGLPGMPQYEFIGEFVTLLVKAGGRNARATKAERDVRVDEGFVFRLNEHNLLYQLSPSWSADEVGALESLGLRPKDFLSVRSRGHIIASAVLWDQRVYKQTVVRGYRPLLALARPSLNVTARFLGQPKLPETNSILANAFVSHLVIDATQTTALIELIAALGASAAQRGIEMLTLGFASNDPRLDTMRFNFRCREYLTRLYVVRWPGIGHSAAELDNRILAPEAALM